MLTRPQSVMLRGGTFIVRDGGRESAFQLSEIVRVEGTKVDKITYEENFLVLTSDDGTKIQVGELAAGFAEFERAIFMSWADFPRQWKAAVEVEPAGVFVHLWARPG